MGKLTPASVRTLKPKKKCCKSAKRCTRCPIVLKRLGRLDTDAMTSKEFRRAVKVARKK